MAKRANVIVSGRAKQLLGNHTQFLAEQSEDAARRVAAEILSAIRSLDTMPERYPFIADKFLPPNKYHKMFIIKQYLLLYQIRDDAVYVDYVIDCRQDYQWLLS